MRPVRMSPPRGRPGFTLIELLTVIAIIAVLATLSAAAVIRYRGVQQKNNTTAILNKLTPVVKSAWVGVAEKGYREFNTPIAQQFLASTIIPIAGSTPDRQKAAYVKLKLVQYFPMTFDEVLHPSPQTLPPLKVYQQKLRALGIQGSSSATSSFESAALLLMALQENVSGQAINTSDLGTIENVPVGSGSIPVLVDGWGTPLAFFRWPTGASDLNAVTAGMPPDPTDPQGFFANGAWLGNPAYVANFLSGIGYTPPGPLSAQLTPLLVSAGPDQVFGLDVHATPISGAASDNLDAVVPPQ